MYLNEKGYPTMTQADFMSQQGNMSPVMDKKLGDELVQKIVKERVRLAKKAKQIAAKYNVQIDDSSHSSNKVSSDSVEEKSSRTITEESQEGQLPQEDGFQGQQVTEGPSQLRSMLKKRLRPEDVNRFYAEESESDSEDPSLGS